MVEVFQILFDGFAERLFTENNEVIEALAFDAGDEAFGVAVLFGASNACADDFYTCFV